jgi:hypothetical protein
MNISKETLAIFKNFASINLDYSLLMRTGNQLIAAAQGQTVASAIVIETFPVDFAFLDMSQFLSLASSIENPEFDFQSDLVLVSGKNTKTKLRYADIDLIARRCEHEKANKFVNTREKANNQFLITEQQLSEFIKTSSLLKLPILKLHSIGDGVILESHDGQNALSNRHVLTLTDNITPQTFSVSLQLDRLKFISGDYQVSVSDTLVQFSHNKQNIDYWIATTIE